MEPSRRQQGEASIPGDSASLKVGVAVTGRLCSKTRPSAMTLHGCWTLGLQTWHRDELTLAKLAVAVRAFSALL